MWDEVISKILIGVVEGLSGPIHGDGGEVTNFWSCLCETHKTTEAHTLDADLSREDESGGGGMSCTTVTLLVRISVPLEAHPGQLELGCENIWPNHADKEMQDSSDIVSGGFWLIRCRLPRGLQACVVGLLAPDSLSIAVGRLARLALKLAGKRVEFNGFVKMKRVDLGARDGATDFDDVLIVQPFGIANEGPFLSIFYERSQKTAAKCLLHPV
ncbi:hypothetical protein C8J57DRAFT_1228734 [Mycena rebaudengoi]|nr:hypothetical protein C8J57DRAFT_1228734 [Mycena rebaudengoi]